MPLNKDQGSVSIRTNVRRGYVLDQSKKEARAILLMSDAMSDLSHRSRQRVLRFIASTYGMTIDRGWLRVDE